MPSIEKYAKEFEDYLTNRSKSRATSRAYAVVVKDLLEFLDYDNPMDISYEDVERYVSHINDRLGNNSKRVFYYGLKKYLLFISGKYGSIVYDKYRREVEKSGREDDLLKPPRRESTEDKPLTKAEVNAFMQITEPHLLHHTIVKTLYLTAQRGNQIAQLNISDIDWEGTKDDNGVIKYHTITIRHSKGDSTYRIKGNTELIKTLKTYIDTEREEPKEGCVVDNYCNKLYHKDALFLNGYGYRWTELGINKMVKRYAVNLQKQGRLRMDINMHCHLWRHTATTIMSEQGLNVKEIMKRTGHKTVECCMHYCHPRDKETFDKTEQALSLDNISTTKPDNTPKPDDIHKPEPKPSKPSDVMYNYTEIQKAKELYKLGVISLDQLYQVANNKSTDTSNTSMYG